MSSLENKRMNKKFGLIISLAIVITLLILNISYLIYQRQEVKIKIDEKVIN